MCYTHARSGGLIHLARIQEYLGYAGSKEWFCRYVDDDASMSLDWMMLLRVHDSRDATLC